MTPLLADYYERLEALHDDVKRVVGSLPDEALNWVPGPDMNSLAVLVMHFTGAERYWIGDMAGGDDSGRVRAEEFAINDLTSADLIQRLDQTLAHSHDTLQQLGSSDLYRMRLSTPHDREFRVTWSLLHALEHSAIHVGHIQIIRQLWDQQQNPSD